MVAFDHVGMDGPASPDCQLIARSAAIATMEAGYANSSNRTGFGQEHLSGSRHRRFGTSRSGPAVLRRTGRPQWLGLKPATRLTIGAEKSPRLGTMSA